jgi:beta-lactamase class A
MVMSRVWVGPVWVLAVAACARGGVFPDRVQKRLDTELARFAGNAGGTLGLCAVEIETGTRISHLGAEPFPMASAFKVPIAVQLLTRVDRRELSLDRMIPLESADLHPGSGILADRFGRPPGAAPGISLSVRRLLELTLLISDNSAADLCLGLAGGPAAVTDRMRRLGIAGIRVDRPTAWMIADIDGVDMPRDRPWSTPAFERRAAAISPEKRSASAHTFDHAPRDSATPDAMADLLARLWSGTALSESSRRLMLDIMARCETGPHRIQGLLPAGTEVEHKTGTIGLSSNDVGFIGLPGGRHLAIAVFLKSSDRGPDVRDRAIAEAARTVYDLFAFAEHGQSP